MTAKIEVPVKSSSFNRRKTFPVAAGRSTGYDMYERENTSPPRTGFDRFKYGILIQAQEYIEQNTQGNSSELTNFFFSYF